jgi:hypothetical protein
MLKRQMFGRARLGGVLNVEVRLLV